MQVLEGAGVQRFPTPFVEGFGWDETGEMIFPNRPEVRAEGVEPLCVLETARSRSLQSHLRYERRAPVCRAGSAEVWCARPCVARLQRKRQ